MYNRKYVSPAKFLKKYHIDSNNMLFVPLQEEPDPAWTFRPDCEPGPSFGQTVFTEDQIMTDRIRVIQDLAIC